MEGWKNMGNYTLEEQLHLFDNNILEKGSKEEKIKCKKCLQFKSRSRFKKGYKWKDMIERVCLSCTKIKEYNIKKLKEIYPYPQQDYQCPICIRTREDIKKVGEHGGNKNNKEVFVLDHNHITHKFRGHICNTCNSGLGFFNDDILRVKNAVKYLEKSS
jgi:RNase P subunit RPR2